MASRVKFIFELVLQSYSWGLRFKTALGVLARQVRFKSMGAGAFHFCEDLFGKSYFLVFAESSFGPVDGQVVPVIVRNINRSRLVLLDISFLLEDTNVFGLRGSEVFDVVGVLGYWHYIFVYSEHRRFFNARDYSYWQVGHILESRLLVRGFNWRFKCSVLRFPEAFVVCLAQPR